VDILLFITVVEYYFNQDYKTSAALVASTAAL